MGEKDITEKNLEAWNDVFADIVNVLLFKGKRLISGCSSKEKCSMLNWLPSSR
jgi:hypothetical protein